MTQQEQLGRADRAPEIISLGDSCCGCGACSAKCPKGCLSMTPDGVGFLRPNFNADLCIGCGACDSTCPVLNRNSVVEPVEVSWAKSLSSDVLQQSSSGGLLLSPMALSLGLLSRSTAMRFDMSALLI